MGRSPPPPRFRIRLEDGAELPVSSVEALARRVARGDLAPHTRLFDASTGEWLESSKAPVVRFILDELRREGAELPPEWEAVRDAGSVASTSFDPPDPLELGLTPVALQPPEPEVEPEGPTPAEEVPEPESTDREDEWVTPVSEGGLFTRTSAPARVRGGPRDEEGHDSGVSTEGPGLQQEKGAGATRRWVWPGGILLAAVVIVAGLRLFGGGSASDSATEGEGGEEGPAPTSAAASQTSPEPPVPAGLDDAARRAATAVTAGFRAAADSIRIAHDLDSAPPSSWLGGNYLANAGDFPEVGAFWEGYGRFLDDFRVLDRQLFLDVVDNLGPSFVAPERLAALRAYIDERYEATLPRRREVYAQLAAVSASALELHDFLVQSSPALIYTPALGTNTVPRDPVLEVGTDDPAVRRGLEARLDALFSALDETRGGGPPSQAGLQDDLFGRFGEF